MLTQLYPGWPGSSTSSSVPLHPRGCILRRLIFLSLAATACNLAESPTTPSETPSPLEPNFSFTGGAGKVLGSTNEGELVEIDLDASTVTLIGDVGTFDGDELGWTDIASDDDGRLFALSRGFTESDFEVHLYEIIRNRRCHGRGRSRYRFGRRPQVLRL